MSKLNPHLFQAGRARRPARPNKLLHVYLALGYPIYRSELMHTLAQSGEAVFVGASADGREAVAACRGNQVDVVVLEYRLANLNGLKVAEQLAALPHRQAPTTLALIDVPEKHVVWGFLSAGVTHLLSKNRSAGELCEAIKISQEQIFMIDPPIQQVVVNSVRTIMPALSEREKKVSIYLARGLDNQEIARVMGLSDGSVRRTVRLLIDKLPLVTDRVDLVIWAWVHFSLDDAFEEELGLGLKSDKGVG